MPLTQANIHLIETVVAFSLIVLLNIFLKKKGILNGSDTPVFTRLLTQVVLPVFIFFQLLRYPPGVRYLLPVLAMFITGCLTLLAAWIIGELLGFSRATTGALMIVSSFGSSALLGYPLIQYTFPNNPGAMTEAILISELAVGLPIFTLCPLVAMHFGEASKTAGSLSGTLLQYFRSPIFIAVVLGFAVSLVHVPLESPFVAPILEAAKMIDGTLAALACLILGMQIKVGSLKRLLPIVAISAVLRNGLAAAAGILAGCCLPPLGFGASGPGPDCRHALGGFGTHIRGPLQMRWGIGLDCDLHQHSVRRGWHSGRLLGTGAVGF